MEIKAASLPPDQAAQLVAAYRREQPADDGAPRAVETALRVPLVDPLTGQDLGIPLVGIVDLVLDGPVGPTIVDFKTAARGGQPQPVMHELQLTAYSYLLRQITGASRGWKFGNWSKGGSRDWSAMAIRRGPTLNCGGCLPCSAAI